MRKVIYQLMVSLDGFIETPERSLDWVIVDEELHTFVNDQAREMGVFLYGRRMYETMIAYWPTADTNPSATEFEAEFARIWQRMPKVVFSRTLKQAGWNSRVVSDNIAEEVMKLKEQPGKDMGLGGADIASTFMRLGLIDEYRLFVQPVVLGNGTVMFQQLKERANLRLIETRTFGSGVVYLRYQLE